MTTLTEPGTVATCRSSRLMWAILGRVLLADALDVIDATVTNIAAPTIVRDLNGGESLIKWPGPAYCSPWVSCSWSADGQVTSSASAGFS